MSRVDSIGDWRDEPTSSAADLTRLLLEAGSLILRAPDEQTLFDRVCRLLVDMGGFRLAWVGLAEPAGDRLSEAAFKARDTATVEALREHARSEQGRRVLTRRLKDREPWVINVRAEREDDDLGNPWASLAARSKAVSIAYLPIVADHVAHGLLVLATDDSGYFTPYRLLGLERLSADVAVKLDWLGRRAVDLARREALERAAARLHAFFDVPPHAILLVSPGTIETNATFARMFGLDGSRSVSRGELGQFFPPDLWKEMVALNRRRSAGKPAPERYEAVGVRADGTRFPILVQVTTLRPRLAEPTRCSSPI